MRRLEAEARSVDASPDPAPFGAVVLGSAVYPGRWMKEAAETVERPRASLAARPASLFSSGPLVLEDGIAVDNPYVVPREIVTLQEALHPHVHRVFFGALDPGTLGFALRAMRHPPASRAVLPEGNSLDGNSIGTWADETEAALQDLPP